MRQHAMTYDVVKMGDNTYQTSAVASQLAMMSNRSSYSIPSSRFTMVDTRPEAVLQLKTLPTKKGRTNPSLTGPKTLLNETI